VNGVAAQRLEGQRGDEFAGGGGHDDAHVAALLAQQANQFRRLVGRDTAANSQ